MEGNEDNTGKEIWENGEKILSLHVPCVICGGFEKLTYWHAANGAYSTMSDKVIDNPQSPQHVQSRQRF